MSRSYKIFIVDDESSVRTGLARALQVKSYQTITASSYLEAHTLLSSGLKFDLAIYDLYLPDGDGMELVSTMKSLKITTPIIVMSGFGNVNLAMSAAQKGALHFVTKPFDLKEFLNLIEQSVEFDDVKKENERLKSSLTHQNSLDALIGQSQEIRSVVDLSKRVADSDSTVLVRGESGTGKERIARGLHHFSKYSSEPFISLNCGAIPDDLLESELFGHIKGAFTGAINDRQGRITAAQKGTLFLDEIGDLSLKTQVKLLRVLQERVYEPLGSNESLKAEARIIAATHQDLEKKIKLGEFREDLFYRLNVIPIHIPPLRSRRTDIPILISHFIKKFNLSKKRNISGLSTEAHQLLLNYSWPGNIREMENLIERLAIIKGEGLIESTDLPERYAKQKAFTSLNADFEFTSSGIDFKQTLSDMENLLITKALNYTKGNKNQAAQLLKMNRTTLVEKIKKKGL